MEAQLKFVAPEFTEAQKIQWRNRNKAEAAVELYTMYRHMTVPKIAYALNRPYTKIYQHFKQIGARLRKVRMGWNQIEPGHYIHPNGKWVCKRKHNSRWVLTLKTDGRKIEFLSFNGAVYYVRDLGKNGGRKRGQ